LDGKGIIELSFAVMLINDGGEKYPNNRDDPILGSVWPHSGPANYKFAVIFSFSSYTPRIMAGPIDAPDIKKSLASLRCC
jgi:hypothetical protein